MPSQMPFTDSYVLDSRDLIWKVVRDGGMATRATYEGVISIGIEALREQAAPLIEFTAWDLRDLLEGRS